MDEAAISTPVSSASSLNASLAELRPFGGPARPPTSRLDSWRHELRRGARALARDADNAEICWEHNFDCTSHHDVATGSPRTCPVLAQLAPSARQRHFEQQLTLAYRHNQKSFETSWSPGREARRRPTRPPRNGQRRFERRGSELDNMVALARSSLTLPGEGGINNHHHYRQHNRTPSLSREGAFYDVSTSAGGKVQVRSGATLEDQQVAELYQQGLLYGSDDKVVGSAFDLNSIRRDEPTYVVRPAKRRSRRGVKSEPKTSPLHLNLSFSDVGDDEAIARYLSTTCDKDETDKEKPQMSSSGGLSLPPLRVIYELAGSEASVDVDASQPPDLVIDSEEFEFLSGSELRDDDCVGGTVDGDSTAWIMVGDV